MTRKAQGAKREVQGSRIGASPAFCLRSERQAGFTVIELMTVVAMIGFVALIAIPFVSSEPTKTYVRNAGLEASDAVREAQAAVMSGKNNAKFGVHFEGTKFVLFEGSTYSAADPNNVVHTPSAHVTITSVALSPGGACTLPAGTGNCDIHFANHKGTPTESGTVVITGDDGNIRTLTVNAAGMIDVN